MPARNGDTVDKPRAEYRLPPLALLDNIAPRIGESGMDHARNAAIITAKLLSFGIPARVVAWNAGSASKYFCIGRSSSTWASDSMVMPW